jgi:hypothetical protein
VEYLLAIQICSGAACSWSLRGHYASEERCVLAGLAIDPAVARFKCVLVGVHQRSGDVPLPRPRPGARD